MKALLIKDNVAWQESRSAEIGRTLRIVDSTFDLLVFDEKHDSADILAVAGKAPPTSFEILELESVSQDECEFIADSGRCYRRKSQN